MSEAVEADREEADGASRPKIKIVGDYVRDLKFSNHAVRRPEWKPGAPEVNITINVDAGQKGVEADQYRVVLHLNVDAREKGSNAQIYSLSLEYCGIFEIRNVSEPEMHGFVMVECPRFLYPFARRIISDVTSDGGFPPFRLEILDFGQIFIDEMSRMAEDQVKN